MMSCQDDHLTIVRYLMRGRSIISSSKGSQRMMTIYNLQSFITLGNEDITFEDSMIMLGISYTFLYKKVSYNNNLFSVIQLQQV